ncbi:hypothetical protein FNO01nite_13880 [Flavobacterium noncentrifugens]|uniref:Uncharacterized protein n=1 Tax=Flavobacterium noncentrifugens TaxID=1128970 RepID=A0A1G8W083_9FLAO|nr:hypothetical protein [Flavobacterium noncentrifugens]GEP50716.1 hypothetical protein FNO01nite_13880 [Flavobacterium noncentrifugens]SDJ71669.1 hypothetical protein SAMN04487935_1591 [Flavobacterium noncentrifugens]
MEKYIYTFKLNADLHIENNEVNAAQSKHLKHQILKMLKSGETAFVALGKVSDEVQLKTEMDQTDGTFISIVLPAHPDNIKGSDGNPKKATAIVLESYNTDLKSIERKANILKIKFEYTGEVHYAIEEKKEPNHYEAYTFVAKGDFGIPALHHTYKNEIVRLCLEALNNPDTVLYEKSKHTTDFEPDLPDELPRHEFEHLVIQLSIPTGDAEFDDGTQNPMAQNLKLQHFDINVFNAEGIFRPEKITYDDGDGIKKLIVSLYYQIA